MQIDKIARSFLHKSFDEEHLRFFCYLSIMNYASVRRLKIGITFAVLDGEVAVPCTRNPL